jgi:TPR repeat protein
MNACNKCDLVAYCNAACKKKHRSRHKKKCEKRAAELHDKALFKEPPPRDDCPICFLPLPLQADEVTFESCCGKTVCNGCIHTMMQREEGDHLCPFCRTPEAKSDEENIKRLKKVVEAGNPYAFNVLGKCYDDGVRGVPQDRTKANELYLKAGELGCAQAYFHLGIAYLSGRGVDIDMKKAKHYFELGAMNGDVEARHNLGVFEIRAGNDQRAKEHYIIAAGAGNKISLGTVKDGYRHGHVTKEEYANTLRAYQKSRDDMKSDARDEIEALFNHAGL